MTAPLSLDHIRSLHAGITPGEWEAVAMGNHAADVITKDDGTDLGNLVICEHAGSDAAFIAAAPSMVAHLLGIVERVEVRIDALMGTLTAREERWKAAWLRGELSHKEAVSATFEDRWAYAELAGIRAAITGEGGA